ncbi:hypothetical protein F3Y22_tig00110264pilonHSYRG00368 [Hibiscus syriacus]|uniref:Uncharacterized protein n=1 Tax=Hibiscus syriacus TaxID=106335 RepID=A0A6A3BAA4_HIBSY|nr:hypothetical protein F3Y22_tig00110264pilonHSYRG00368 [Hibiscus syriacus]
MEDKSQIKAWESSPTVQIWQELWGAHAMALTLAWCLCSSTTDSVGKRISKTTTLAVHNYSGHILGPACSTQPYKRSIGLRTLINNSEVLLVAKVENPN